VTGLGADIAAVLPLLRDAAESMQTVPGKLVRLGEAGTPDPVTLKVTRPQAVIYQGTARIKPMKRVTDTGVSAGEAKDSKAIYIISLPPSVTGAEPGDQWVTTDATFTDLAGDVFRVVDVEDGTEQTAKRLTCELVEARQ
jgi:hypothetical protein